MQLGLPFESSTEPPPPAIASAPIDAAAAVSPVAPAPPAAVRTDSHLFRTSSHSLTLLFVRHRRARRYVLRVDDEGRARVTIPRGGSKREAEAFAVRHRRWIERQRARLAAPVHSPDERREARVRAVSELPARLGQLAADLGLQVARVSVRNQRARWGSCGRDGHICLNWRLVLMPAWVRDYVLIHELMHLRRLDHSPAYWGLVAAACPAYQDARRWLRVNGPGLR